MPLGVMIIEQNCEIALCNEKMASFFGVEPVSDTDNSVKLDAYQDIFTQYKCEVSHQNLYNSIVRALTEKMTFYESIFINPSDLTI